MATEKNPVLYPNQLFKFDNVEFLEKDNTCFTKVFLANGKKYKVKVVQPFPVDKTRTVLEGATKDSLQKSIEEIVNQKYNLKTVVLSDSVLDSIEDELDGLKLDRKKRREKQEELENIKINELKEIMKKQEIEDFFTSNSVYQANGIFLNISNNSGLLQIPGDSRFKAKNLHSVAKDNPFVDFTFTNKTTKEVLTLEDTRIIDPENIKMNAKINYLTERSVYNDVFTINKYLIRKLSDSVNKKVIPFELYNLISFSINEDLHKFTSNSIDPKNEEIVETFKTFFNNEFVKSINDIMQPYRKDTSNEKVISHEDATKLEKIYENFYEVFVLGDVTNEVYINNKEIIEFYQSYFKVSEFNTLVPSFININLSIFIQNDKKRDYINFIVKNWLDTKDSMFNVMKNKEKLDYFSVLEKIKLENITSIFKIIKIYEKDRTSKLHDIYVYPAINNVKTPTPRLIAYSVMQDSLVPNILPPTDGKNRGFITTIEVIEDLKTKF